MAYVTDKAHPTGWGLPQGINAVRPAAAPIRRPPMAPAPMSMGAAPSAAAPQGGMQGQIGQAGGPMQGNQQSTAAAAQQLLSAPGAPPPMAMPNAAASMEGGQQATAQAAQQMQRAPQYQSMVDQGAQMAGSLSQLGQVGDQMAAQQNQMQHQAELMRAAAMRNTRTPSGMMGQMGTLAQAPQAQNPFAGMLQSANDAYKQRGWGVDPVGGGYTHPQAGQQAGALQDWGKAMQTTQNQSMAGMPGWAQAQMRGGSAAPSWGGHW